MASSMVKIVYRGTTDFNVSIVVPIAAMYVTLDKTKFKSATL